MKTSSYTLPVAVLGALLPLTTNAAPDNSLKVSAQQRDQLSLTLYNQNLGLVRETRQLPILKASQSVLIEDVSAQLQPETLQLKNAGQIIEQNHNTDLLSYTRLLQHYLGKSLQLAEQNPATGTEQVSTVRLMALNGNQALIERNSQIESLPLNNQRRFIFPALPDNLTLSPSISFRSQGTDQANKAEISYLTGGLSWQMNYVLELNKAGDSASLNGMATLHNNTGSSFPQARISLLAGQVNQPHSPVMQRKAERVMMSAMAMDASTASAPSRQQLQDFHLYSLPQPVDLQNNQQKQVSLFSSSKIGVERIHQLNLPVYAQPQPERKQINPSLQLKFANSGDNGLGEPMPAGTIRVFSPDKSNQSQFIGGSRIGNQARNNDVYVQLGTAFDVTVDQQQTRFEKTFDGVKSDLRLVLKNSAKRPAQLKLSTRFQKRWQISNNSHPYETNGNAAVWQLTLPASSETEVTFQVQQFNK